MENTETFDTRSGTTDKGNIYENLIASFLALQFVLDDSIKDFQLSLNDKNFGSFDDIVLNAESKNYAIQLKHSNGKREFLNPEAFTSSDKSLRIQSYFESLKEVVTRADYKFILMTNKKFKNDNVHIFIDKVPVVIRKCEECDLLNFGSCYKFEIDNSNDLDENEEYKLFFEKFYLLTDQPDADEIEKLFIDKFKKVFCCSQKDAERFLKYISDWNLLEGKKDKLDKNFVKEIMAYCMLEDFIKPFYFGDISQEMKVFQEAINCFHITVFREESYNDIKIMSQNIKDELKKSEIQQLMKQFLPGRFRENVDNLDPIELNRLFWLMKKCPLIVRESETTFIAMNLCLHQRFILLQEKPESGKLLGRIFRNLSDLVQEPKIYEKLLNAVKGITIQWKESITKASLKSFIADHDKLLDVITTNELLMMLNNSYNIGKTKDEIFEPYITRSITVNLIDINYLKNIDKNTLIVLDCMNKRDCIKDKIGNFNLRVVERYLKTQKDKIKENCQIFGPLHRHLYRSSPVLKNFVSGPDMFVSNDSCLSSDFLVICEKNPTVERIHHLKIVDENTLEWIRSRGDVSDLQKYRREDTFMNETELYRKTPDNNINVITGDAGMGKSELLKNLKNNSLPKKWTVLMCPKDMILLCQTRKGEQQQKERVIDFLINQKYAEYSEFEKHVIKVLLEKDQVVYFWDAIDELNSKHCEMIMHIIDELASKNVCQWITCRSHLKNMLETRYTILSRHMKQFNLKEQTYYIQERLKDVSKDCNITPFVEKIISTMTLMKQNHILGIPLQIFMLTELFRQDPKKYAELVETFFTLSDLYNHIIEKRFERFYTEKALVFSPNESMKQVLKAHKSTMCEKYQEASLKALITNELLKQINVNCDDFSKDLQNQSDCLGLITEITNNFPQFLHNSYAEFFVAKYFTEHYDKIKDVKEILFMRKNVNIRFFFDLLTAKGSKAHVAVLYGNIGLLKEHKEFLPGYSDEGGRNVLQLACSWGQRFPILEVEKHNEVYIIKNETDELHTGEKAEYIQMLEYLLDHCDVTASDTIYNEDTIVYAEKAECLLTKLKILTKRGKDFSLKIDSESLSMLYYSAKFGYDEIFNIFTEIPFIKTKKDDFSLLHLSVICQQKAFLEKLLSKEIYRANINDKDKNGETALYKACQNGYINIASLLINAGARADVGAIDGSTPLHTACLHHQFDIVQLLLNNNENINIINNHGVTPLHVACWNGHRQVVKLLVQRGADINATADDGCTPLYVSSRNNHDRVVSFLLTCELNINFPQEDNVTPLCVASQEGHDKNVKLLLKANADVNIASCSGESPIYLASQNGYKVVVKMLIEHGCNVNAATNDGWTSLHIAAQQDYPDIIELLLNAGANIHAVNIGGKTPLDVAKEHTNSKIVEILNNAM